MRWRVPATAGAPDSPLPPTSVAFATASPPAQRSRCSTAAPLSSQRSVPSPLVSRGRELTLLDRHLAGEGPPVLLLAGEPGIGKSRLLAEAAERGQGLGWQVPQAGC